MPAWPMWDFHVCVCTGSTCSCSSLLPSLEMQEEGSLLTPCLFGASGTGPLPCSTNPAPS